MTHKIVKVPMGARERASRYCKGELHVRNRGYEVSFGIISLIGNSDNSL